MKKIELAGWMRMLLVACGLALLLVLYFPIWRIDLDAPQYPEGLRLLIFADKLGGNVEVINGLNHYIGMNTLHTDDFVEFKVLPVLIVFYALLFVGVGIAGKRRFLSIGFAAFVLFGIVAMVGFWRWEYNYGHNLNPNAAIVVPGMAYQPPLIGFKQLLNFGAYSIPDIGGWIFVAVGVLLLTCVFVEWKRRRKTSGIQSQTHKQVAAVLLLVVLMSCNSGPEAIKIGVDDCAYCKMTISDARFGAELLTKKGKLYKFDDMHCLLSFLGEKTVASSNIQDIYFVDFSGQHQLGKAGEMLLGKSDALKSPMGSNIAAFKISASMEQLSPSMNIQPVNWNDLYHP